MVGLIPCGRSINWQFIIFFCISQNPTGRPVVEAAGGAPCQHQLVLVPPVSPCCYNSHRPAFGSAAPVKLGQIVKINQTFENFPKKCEQLSKLTKRQPTAGTTVIALLLGMLLLFCCF